MEIEQVISLFALCIPLVLSVTGAAVRICSKLEKISAALENMMTRNECSMLRLDCRTARSEDHNCSNSAASESPISAARRSRRSPWV